MEIVQASKTAKISFKKQVALMKSELGIEAPQIGMMPRIFAQATLPHRDPKKNKITRENGNFTLTMTAAGNTDDLPYGVIPRIFLAWVTAEVKKTGNRTVDIGVNSTALLRALGFNTNGGVRGDLNRVNEQIKRLFSMVITIEFSDGKRSAFQNSTLFDSGAYKHNEAWTSQVRLSEAFYAEAMNSSIPVDFDALKALGAPMAMDIYIWLSHRMSYLGQPSLITWTQLQLQFGSDYGRLLDFKKSFKKSLLAVRKIYVGANIEAQKDGLLLRPSRPHITKTKIKKLKHLSRRL